MNRILSVFTFLLTINFSFGQVKTLNSIDEIFNVELDCTRFKRDLDIVRSFGYPVQINPLIKEEKTYAIINTASQVEELQIYRQTSLSLDVFCLTQLQTLRVYGTPFDSHFGIEDQLINLSLSPLIGRLTRLRILSLINTTAIHIPSQALAALTNLTILEVNNCGLREIPTTISTLINLQQLRLPNNNLHQIPQDIALRRLAKLTLIDFSHNKIRDITDISDLASRSVTSMDFSYNQIDYIPPEIGQFYYDLLYLYLNDNKLDYIPTDIFRLIYLKKIDLQRNQFPDSEITAIKGRFRTSIPNTQILI